MSRSEIAAPQQNDPATAVSWQEDTQAAAQADEQAFLAAMSKVPSVAPDEHDKL